MRLIALFISCIFTFSLFAQRGKNGNKTVSITESVNAYTTLTINASIGATSLSVTNSNLSANFGNNLSAGDLLLIIQMQGASMNATCANPPFCTFGLPVDTSWGSILNYNNCGNYEFLEVASVPNNTTINLNCALTKNYTASGKVQVIRVPRFNTLTVNNGGTINSPAWNGSTGGVVAIEVLGNTVINNGGSINVSALGFRGGTTESQSTFGAGQFARGDASEGAEKGEGIAGDTSVYSALGGKYCRGAAANGGGGGNAHNAGGGGGANAGLGPWSGLGNPDNNTNNYITAWNLEGANFANHVSSGGGRGGYTFSNTNANELTLAPGSGGWGGDSRRNVGGMGGRPLDYNTGRIFMGGGGGAGDANDPYPGAGGNGAGIVYMLTYANISGAGQILANGANGLNSFGNNFTGGNDGAGGGGAGGTIILSSTGTVSGITINANGGNGGNQVLGINSNNQAEGPGGGGGGGYTAVSNGSPTQTVNGGNNGTSNSNHITNFPPNGATRGGIGLASQPFTAFNLVKSNDTTICEGTSATLTASLIGNPPGGLTITWFDAQFGGNVLGIGNTYTTPILNNNTTYYVGVCPGTFRLPIVITVVQCLSPIADFSSSDSSFCEGSCIDFTNLSVNSNSWQWYFPGGNPSTSIAQHPTNICYNTPGTYTVSLVAYDGNGASDSIAKVMFITVFENPMVDAGNNQTSCNGDSVSIQATASGGTLPYSFFWNNGLGSGSSHLVAPATTTTYTVTLTDANGCTSTDSVIVTVGEYPTVLFEFDTLYNACLPSCVTFTNQSSISSGSITQYLWNFGDGNTSSQTNPVYCYLNAGNYSVSLTAVSNLGCSASYIHPLFINIAAQVNAAFITDGNNPFKPNIPINVTDQSSGGDIIYYLLSTGDTLTQTNPVLNFTEDGVYTICQIVRNSLKGCEDSACTLIEVIGELIIPNVFTPNGDGNNDIFYIRGLYGKNNKMEIFTRWGQMVYYNETYGNDWDGRTSSGLEVSAGTYYFILKTTDGKEYTGSFTLLR
ncbi:MAG: PKD domain-containing protein [Bacteroidetes bacterium]|nr:PKD domain-containing protein [Bacteroidota bacterium]MBV6461676.1 hypothetical protein [Flavobacteriales bacterium]WKZ74156.1 MAG: PKD domain-containing protein [Vicingaceae bacterium]MCL4816827.1 gliding motility-associated C-terminal domain-containing protein [Flavobacteriales bacterium]NOG95765.1 PKD domain-containing protein [Bacteroidota bacterium]